MKNTLIRSAAAVAVAGTAFAGMAAGAANADTFIPLPNGKVSVKVGSGAITIVATGQSAKLSPGMVALPTTRNAWVSGTVRATIKGKEPGNGSIEAGYVIGCQVAIGDTNITLGATADSGVSISSADGPAVAPKGETTSEGSISLSAGTIGNQPLTLDKATFPKAGDEIKPSTADSLGWQAPSKSFSFDGDSGSLSWSDATIGADGCAGYAQARFYAYVTGQVGNHEGTAVLWGKPFTLG